MASKKEKYDVRIPFGHAVRDGLVPGWEGSLVLKNVCFDPRWKPGRKMKSEADLVLVKPGKGIAVVECKLKTGAAKYGAVEQVLMYAEQAREAIRTDTLYERLGRAEVSEGCGEMDEDNVRDVVEHIGDRRDRIQHIVALDKWGSNTLPNTVALTLKMLNPALEKGGIPVVRVYSLEDGGFIEV